MSQSNGLFSNTDHFKAAAYMLMGATMPMIDWYEFGMRTNAEVIGVLLGCATFATLWMPGASFPKNEWWQSWFLSNGTIGLFGNLGGGFALDLWLRADSPTPASPLAVTHGFFSCFIVYFSYWSSGHQSREYVRQLYEGGQWPEKLPDLQRVLTALCYRPKQHGLAREIQQHVIDGRYETILDDGFWHMLTDEVVQGTTGTHRQRLQVWLDAGKLELQAMASPEPEQGLRLVRGEVREVTPGR